MEVTNNISGLMCCGHNESESRISPDKTDLLSRPDTTTRVIILPVYSLLQQRAEFRCGHGDDQTETKVKWQLSSIAISVRNNNIDPVGSLLL